MATKHPVLCIYIHDEQSPGLRAPGAAARWWLHGSLATLADNLAKRGARFVVLSGKAADVFERLIASRPLVGVYWNRRYGAAEIDIDRAIKANLGERGISCITSNGALLREPWEVKTADGRPMRVFTPFWRAARALGDPAPPLPAPKKIIDAGWRDADGLQEIPLASLQLEPAKPNWAKGFSQVWTRGEDGAKKRVAAFLDDRIDGYTDARDRPDREGTSRLSPHLRFGDVSPRQIWHAAMQKTLDAGAGPSRDIEKFLAELGWREFSYNLLFNNPDLATANFQSRFDAFPWREPGADFEAWTRGRTGYPLVDAGMRELWTIGWMHNRVRMIAASFLIKHLLIDWRKGEEWFWNTLVDADPANNPASWQWVAGSGADAAPYFRIFNPVLQGEKFDPRGDYIRRWIPELARLPDEVIHRPWTASEAVLKSARVRLGESYPRTIVDHAAARQRALTAFSHVKS